MVQRSASRRCQPTEKKWDEVYRKEINSYSWEPSATIKRFSGNLARNRVACVGRVLDLGCGIAQNAIYLAKKGYFVVGVDISGKALQTAAMKVNLENICNIVLLHNTAKSLPFPDGHFNAVFSINVLHHGKLKDIRRAINEILRVLRSEGLGMATLVSKSDYKFGKGREVEKDTFELFEGEHGEKGILHHFFGEYEIDLLLRNFQIIEKNHITQEVVGGVNCHWYVVFRKPPTKN